MAPYWRQCVTRHQGYFFVHGKHFLSFHDPAYPACGMTSVWVHLLGQFSCKEAAAWGFATPAFDNLQSAMLWICSGRTALTFHMALAISRLALDQMFMHGQLKKSVLRSRYNGVQVDDRFKLQQQGRIVPPHCRCTEFGICTIKTNKRRRLSKWRACHFGLTLLSVNLFYLCAVGQKRAFHPQK